MSRFGQQDGVAGDGLTVAFFFDVPAPRRRRPARRARCATRLDALDRARRCRGACPAIVTDDADEAAAFLAETLVARATKA